MPSESHLPAAAHLGHVTLLVQVCGVAGSDSVQMSGVKHHEDGGASEECSPSLLLWELHSGGDRAGLHTHHC